MNQIELQDLCKTYHMGELDVPVLKGITLTVQTGELVALMGASGSGKTTLMNILGCLDHPTSGHYRLEGDEISGLTTDERALLRNRKIGFVFQTFNLLPRTSALDNVIMPLSYTAEDVSDREGRQRATELLQRVGLGDRLRHDPAQLSGGQQQRVALARALVVEPAALLLDEPLSNLDTKLRAEVREEIRRLHMKFRTTTLYVTHDQEEALSLADRLAVMRDGRVEQEGTPKEVYSRPTNAFVATFVGEANLFRGRVTKRSSGEALVETPHGPLVSAASVAEGQQALLSVRPERVELEPAAEGPWCGTVRDTRFFGGTVRAEVAMANGDTVIARVPGETCPEPGTAVRVRMKTEDVIPLEE